MSDAGKSYGGKPIIGISMVDMVSGTCVKIARCAQYCIYTAQCSAVQRSAVQHSSKAQRSLIEIDLAASKLVWHGDTDAYGGAGAV